MEPTPKISQGSILASGLFLDNTCFKRSVVLLAEHNTERSIGFILNKPTDIKITDAVEDFPDFNSTLYFGGPAETDTLYFIHTLGDKLPGSKKITDDIYWGGNYEQLKLLVAIGKIQPHMIRFFAGYAGWEPSSVKEEVEETNWMLSTFNREIIFSKNSNDLWRTVLRSMGGKYAITANYPEDPQWN